MTYKNLKIEYFLYTHRKAIMLYIPIIEIWIYYLYFVGVFFRFKSPSWEEFLWFWNVFDVIEIYMMDGILMIICSLPSSLEGFRSEKFAKDSFSLEFWPNWMRIYGLWAVTSEHIGSSYEALQLHWSVE